MTKDLQESSNKNEYKGQSPYVAAFTGAMSKAAFLIPFTFAAGSTFRLVYDKLVYNLPLGQNTWSRFKSNWSDGKGIPAIIVGISIAGDIYKEGKQAYKEAQGAVNQHNTLVIENTALTKQNELLQKQVLSAEKTHSNEANHKENLFAHEHKSYGSHADQIIAEKEAAAEVSTAIA